MADKIQHQSTAQGGRTLGRPHSKIRFKKTIETTEVELEDFPNNDRLQALSEGVEQELGLNPPETQSSPQKGGQQFPVWTLGTLAIVILVLGGSVDLLVFKGFDTLLAAAKSPEGSMGVGRAMGEYLKNLAPFVKVVFGGIVLGSSMRLSYKVWKRGRRSR